MYQVLVTVYEVADGYHAKAELYAGEFSQGELISSAKARANEPEGSSEVRHDVMMRAVCRACAGIAENLDVPLF